MARPFSTRSSFDLTENALAQAFRTHGQENVLDLTEANPTKAGFTLLPEELTRALSSPFNVHYTPDALGYAEARASIARDLATRGHVAAPERIFLTTSTSEAYGYLFKLLCDPGDEVLVPSPSYPLFDYLAQLEGIEVRSYPLGFDGAFYFDASEARACVSSRTKAIVVVNPNNPTGTYLRRDALEALLDTDIAILSDEVFECYEARKPSSAVSASTASRGLTFSLFGLSKQAALPQLKLGWTLVAGDGARVHEAMARLEVIGDAYLSVSAPTMNAVSTLLPLGARTREAILARAQRNLTTAHTFTRGSAVNALPVEGGIYLVLRIPETESDLVSAVRLLREKGVHVHPGHFFGFPRGAFFVVSLLTPESIFSEGLARTCAFFDEA